jgi:hypothetical protein
MPISVGYFAPYFINPGVRVSTAFEIKNWENSSNDKLKTLSVSPQVGFWNVFVYQSEKSNNWALDAQLEYRSYNASRKFYGLASVGLGYHLTLDNSDLNVNIGTGGITPSTNTTHHFVPSIQLGFGQDFNDHLGYYFKIFTGQRFSSSAGNDLLFGGELGLSYYLNANK